MHRSSVRRTQPPAPTVDLETRHRAALESMRDAYFLWSPIISDLGDVLDFELHELNARAAELLGAPAAELRHRRHGDLFHGVDRAAFFRLAAVAGTGHPFEGVVRHDDDAGGVWMHERIDRVGDAVQLIARDMRERHRIEVERELSRGVLHAMCEGVLVVRELDKKIVFANPRSAEILGYGPDELLGLDVGVLGADPLGPDVVLGAPIEVEHVRRDGRRIVSRLQLGRLEHPQHGRALIAVHQDVTEQRDLTRRVSQAERLAAVGTLAAGIAHEINNPLAVVASNLDVAVESIDRVLGTSEGDQPLRREVSALGEIIREAQHGSARVRAVVDDMRRFARGEDAAKISLGLPGVLDTAIRMTANLIRHCAVLERRFGAVPQIEGNEGQLVQVFVNILANAAEAIGEGRADDHRVVVATETDRGGRAVVTIHDSGPGLTAEMASRIFDPFFTTKPVGRGTGIGLSICHGIVVQHGGELSVESEPGRGTCFRVVLPPAAPIESAAPRIALASRSPAVASAPAGSAPRGRVLVIDDEPGLGKVVQRILGRDHEVLHAACGSDGLARLAEDARFDLILCDVSMPDMTGVEVYRRLAAADAASAARLVFLTGGALSDATADALAELGRPILGKPFEVADLRAELTVRLPRG